MKVDDGGRVVWALCHRFRREDEFQAGLDAVRSVVAHSRSAAVEIASVIV